MTIYRADIIENSYLWPDQSVLYSMTSTNTPTRHRADCSGYVSMCLGLATPGLSTVYLANVCTPITVPELLPGDIIGNLGQGTEGANGHVQLFTGWADDGRLTIAEQVGGTYGPIRHTIAQLGYGYSPYRFTETAEDAAAIEEEEIDMGNANAWVAQDQYGIALVWLDTAEGSLWQNVGLGSAVGGWQGSGAAGPVMVESIGAIGRNVSEVWSADAIARSLSIGEDPWGERRPNRPAWLRRREHHHHGE
jgi:hypothetical protein